MSNEIENLKVSGRVAVEVPVVKGKLEGHIGQFVSMRLTPNQGGR